MEEDNIQKTINEIFNGLPPKIQDTITNSGWEQKIRTISKRYDLVIGDAGTLETQTFLVMLGLKSPKDYKKNLVENLDVDSEKIDSILREVDEKIFLDIKSTLVSISESKEEESVDEINFEKEPEITPQTINNEIGDEIEILDNEEVVDPVKESFVADNLQKESMSLKEEYEIKEAVEKEKNSPAIESTEFDPYREPIDLDDVEI